MPAWDDPKTVAANDPGRMLAALDGYVDDFLTSWKAGSRGPLKIPSPLRNVVISGLGGSGIVGSLAAELVRDSCAVPIVIVKDYDLPAFAGKDTLVICVSYSGNTEETLDVALQAKGKGCTLITISSGGRLQRVHGAHEQHISVPADRQPRAALPLMLGSLLGVLSGLKLTKHRLEPASERHVRSFHEGVKLSTSEQTNRAKRTARALVEKYPSWYAARPLVGVALRARHQINENSKMLARNDEVPECNHNDLVPWGETRDGARHWVGILRTASDPPQIARRLDFFIDLLERQRVTHEEFVADAPGVVGQVLQALVYVDYVSVYAALLRGVDPTPVPIIGQLKDLLAKHGRAPQLAKQIP